MAIVGKQAAALDALDARSHTRRCPYSSRYAAETCPTVTSPSPLQVIACEPPRFSDAEAREIVQSGYGLTVETRQLVSERDQNFRLKAVDRGTWVLKIANAGEDPAVTDFQIRALQHIAARKSAVNVPSVLPTLTGEDRLFLKRDDAVHVARVVSYLDGEPLEEGAFSAP